MCFCIEVCSFVDFCEGLLCAHVPLRTEDWWMLGKHTINTDGWTIQRLLCLWKKILILIYVAANTRDEVTTPIIDQTTAQKISGSAMFGTVENMNEPQTQQVRSPAMRYYQKCAISNDLFPFLDFFSKKLRLKTTGGWDSRCVTEFHIQKDGWYIPFIFGFGAYL